MLIYYSKLKTFKVYTQSNDYLGKVVDLEIDAQTQQITKYKVKKQLREQYSLIAPEQIIKVENNFIIVDDNSIKVSGGQKVEAHGLAATQATLNSQR